MLALFSAADALVAAAAVSAIGGVAVSVVTARRVGKPNGKGNVVQMSERSLAEHAKRDAIQDQMLKILEGMAIDVRQVRGDLMNHIHDGHPKGNHNNEG